MGSDPEQVRIVRIFVSSPGDVNDERHQVEEVLRRINASDGRERGLRLEMFSWKRDVIPKIGPPPQQVVDEQTPLCEVYLGILSTRFGTPTGDHGSGTEKELRDAMKRWGATGRPWILFYFQDDPPAAKSRVDHEQYGKVLALREVLEQKGIVGTFKRGGKREEQFFDQVETHLRALIREHLAPLSQPASVAAEPKGLADATAPPIVPNAYLDWLRAEASEMSFLGLDLKHGQAARLSQVYVPLTTTPEASKPPKSQAPETFDARPEKLTLLLERLDRGSLYVSGPPGSGKSTFSRWAAWLACSGAIPATAIEPPETHREAFPASFRGRLPVLIPLRGFWERLPRNPGAQDLAAPELLAALEAWAAQKLAPHLDGQALAAHLKHGTALLILDGADEVPPTVGEGRDAWHPRTLLLSGLESALPDWLAKGNRVLLTSRPHGLTAADLERLKLPHAAAAPLDDDLQRLFIRRWYGCLAERPEAGASLTQSLIEHLDQREIPEALRSSPMLLSGLCALYQEGKRLPQDQHALYKRLVDYVLHNRYPSDPALLAMAQSRLAVVAHGMHTGTGLGEERLTPRFEVTYGEIERLLEAYQQASAATAKGYRGTVEAREELLSRSGLLLPRSGERAGFFHASFQEFLAALRALDLETGRLVELFRSRAEVPEWHNTLVFLFGALVSRGMSADPGVLHLAELLRGLEPGQSLGLAIVVSRCLRILLGRKLVLPESMKQAFRRYTLDAIATELTVEPRWELARMLGELGDPRVPDDVRDPSLYVEVAAGIYLLGEEKTRCRLKRAFLIAKYPVTNAQFAPFVKEGYDPEASWWSREGAVWQRRSQVKEPRFWQRDRWNGSTQPVVGVSYWEAEAFASWAGARLPTNEEWEAAARGPRGLEYPWGAQWEDGICNTSEAALGRTSPVGMFPRSGSQAFPGLEDMTGNVWEWCCTAEGDAHVVRGGSWIIDSRNACAAFRLKDPPEFRIFDLGIRLVQ